MVEDKILKSIWLYYHGRHTTLVQRVNIRKDTYIREGSSPSLSETHSFCIKSDLSILYFLDNEFIFLPARKCNIPPTNT